MIHYKTFKLYVSQSFTFYKKLALDFCDIFFFQIRVAFGLVERYHVPQKSIAIVCTTMAQRDIILQKLEQTYTNFVVCTVLELQGEIHSKTCVKRPLKNRQNKHLYDKW